MQCVGVEIVTACRACGAAVAINGIVAQAPCPKCARGVELGADFWKQVFTTAMVQIAPRALHYEIATNFTSAGQSIRVVFRRANMPSGVTKRDVPPGLHAEGIAFVAGEDLESMRTDFGPSVVMMHCPACGAPLEVAKGSRELACVYCGNTSLIAGEERAIGRPVRRFHLACDMREGASQAVTWERVEAVAIDEDDRAYVLSGSMLLALDASLGGVRWSKSGIDDASGAQLVARGDRIIVVRKSDNSAPTCMRASDGESLGAFPFGGPPPIRSLAPLGDETWLVAVNGKAWGGQYEHTIFHRCTNDGTLVPTWGDTLSSPPELGTIIPELKKHGAKPMVLRDEIDLVAGFHGAMLLSNGDSLARFDAQGEVRVLLEHPRGVNWSYQQVAVDGLQRIHAITHSDTSSGRYIVFDPRGELAMKVDRGSPTFGRERRIAATRAGGVILVGDGGRVRALRPDGTLGYVSAASAKDDQGAST